MPYNEQFKKILTSLRLKHGYEQGTEKALEMAPKLKIEPFRPRAKYQRRWKTQKGNTWKMLIGGT